MRSFGSFAEEDANSRGTLSLQQQNVFLGHIHGKSMQLNHPKTKRKTESLTLCDSVRHVRSRSPKNQDDGVFFRISSLWMLLEGGLF